jgi:hypothetical protein
MKRHERALVLAAAAAAALALSCDPSRDAGVVGAGAAGEGGAVFEVTNDARYSVPVPEELADFATYPVARVRVTRDEVHVRIAYGFPRWLGGIRQRIRLEGAYASDGTPFDVTAGELGAGSCIQIGSHFECHELLPGIRVDLAQAELLMQEAGLSAVEIEQRLKVSAVFTADPIGILAFELAESVP